MRGAAAAAHAAAPFPCGGALCGGGMWPKAARFWLPNVSHEWHELHNCGDCQHSTIANHAAKTRPSMHSNVNKVPSADIKLGES
jgi:hypothetical protein